ncbi:hypothetical protein K523DRAFT_380655, partial [Schizophyllum commune Tattone D]
QVPRRSACFRGWSRGRRKAAFTRTRSVRPSRVGQRRVRRPTPMALSHVSRSWRAIALSYPALWWESVSSARRTATGRTRSASRAYSNCILRGHARLRSIHVVSPTLTPLTWMPSFTLYYPTPHSGAAFTLAHTHFQHCRPRVTVCSFSRA